MLLKEEEEMFGFIISWEFLSFLRGLNSFCCLIQTALEAVSF